MRSDFLRAANKGKRFACPAFILQYYHDDTLTTARYGLTATKKLGNAVIRNRARRRLRALAEELIVAKAKAGDYILIAREALLPRAFSDVRADLQKALQVLRCAH